MDRTALALVDARDPQVERIWLSLEEHAHPSYFLSWGWIQNWLAVLPSTEMPALAVMHDGDSPSAAFFLAQRRVRRSLVLPTNALYVNATGSRRHNGVGIEHNGILARPGIRRSLSAVLDALPGDWDEVYLPAVDRYAFDDLGAPASPLATRYRVGIQRESPAPFVDLDAVRTVDGGYDALLPPSTRTQLRHTQSMIGGIDLELALDERHAMDIYGEMLSLHARRWAARAEQSPIADPWCERFHRRLIRSRLPHGEIQLVRIKAGGTTLGCLFNLVYRGYVTFYLCGLAKFNDHHLKPGYLCHAAVIEYNALAGHATYDLLGGHAKYTENLATGMNRRVWLRVQRPEVRFSIETNMRRWYEMLLGAAPYALGRP